MMIILILGLPLALLISGIILGMPRKSLSERYVFWMSCTGVALFFIGAGIATVGSMKESKIYCDNLAMGPITTVGNVSVAIGVLLSLIVAFVQLVMGVSRWRSLICGTFKKD
jgi:hypothetical protein